MKNHALIDWLNFTLPAAYTEYDIAPVIADLFKLPFDSFVKSERRQKSSFYRVHHCYRSEKLKPLIHVNTEPSAANNGNTTSITVTGMALSAAYELNIDPVALIANVLNRGGRLTRIDLALDYFGYVPLLQNMLELSAPDVWRDHVVTKLRFTKPVAIWDESLYFGHLSKGKVICAYDKARQTGTPGPWFRCEFRTNDRALCSDIAKELVTGIPLGTVAARLIGDYLRFVPSGPRPRDKRPMCGWWTDFLSDAEGYELTRHRDGKSSDDDAERKPPKPSTFRHYLDSILAIDDTGELLTIMREVITKYDLKGSFD